ncbi:hypothetical protein [Sulfitobacter geojensis]|uniref:hypothetical protein n=1 Tax=Sulfitobacter geojensis TaxID=1342299 RepID=UPI003B8D628D
MKLFITTAAAALISTAAFADNSDRYNDLRLDTSKTANQVFSDETRPTDLDAAQRGASQQRSTADSTKNDDVSISTRSAIKSQGEGYIYGGFGEGNDSR